MRKTWIKADNIYYKPFYKQKLKLALIFVVTMGIMFFIYQLVYISQLPTLESIPTGKKIHPNKVKSYDTTSVSKELTRRPVNDRPIHGFGKPKAVQRSKTTYKIEASKQSFWFDIRLAYLGKESNNERNILRGLRLVDIHLYNKKPGIVKFRCISSGKEIPWEWVNDDYCDCPDDGSDEPSTSACTQGRFYCRFQKPHKPGLGQDVFVSSSWVNDGVCDCCDGSDEFLTRMITGSDSYCPNICKTK